MTTTSRHFIVRGQNAWGRGDDALEAYTNCRRNAGLVNTSADQAAFELFDVPEGTLVTAMGGLSYPIASEAPRRVAFLSKWGKLVPRPADFQD